ncbi:amino acid adenylation domain-containing protein [Pseudomonas brassicacearum]|uniref:Amino acid adenylation domain-containing protein n=1 Tax=Pseudomonas brassicacearum TaxID=930166 RepID=A0AAW8M9H0_9PSED|nr:non-ribosomal peptide synthetase [Pseudomonas brassicacearum]MDR6958091.1 amino acid adenylation domain-containing protein [Pseudomonas brassicacearum]
MEINPNQLAERIARLTPQKREAFAAALAAQGIALSRLPIVPSPDEGPRPLSWAQQRLWFLHRLDPDSSAYNMPAALRLRGLLNLDALQHSFDQLVMRHSILRSTFHEAEGKAHQVIHEQLPLTLARIDLCAEQASVRPSRLQQLIDSETNRPFDLQQAPLRCLLVKLSDDEHVLILTAQHIVADGWSLGILVKELTAFYSAALQGVEAQLPALPVQYGDYAVWQQTCMSDSALAPELTYWREHLAGEQPVLELPVDHPRQKHSSGRGARHYLTIDPALTDGLRALAKARGTTLFTVLLSAFNVLLYRLSGQTDLRVGVPVANRTRMETEGLIGCFINTLVMRCELNGRRTFNEVLEDVNNARRNALEHQQLPFERLVQALEPERHLSHSPLFQVMFNLLDDHAPRRLQLPGLEIEEIEREQMTAPLDLVLNVSERSDRLEVCFTYNADLFEQDSIVNHGQAYACLLQGLARAPDSLIAHLPIRDAEAEQHLLAQCQASLALSPLPELVHLRLAAQAAQTPDSLALIHDERAWSYAELQRRVDRIAQHLLALDLPAEARIGLCLPRGLDIVAAVFGVLKAGLAFVPLDPQFPAERLAHMIDDADIRLVLVDASTAPVVEPYQRPILDVCALAPMPGVQPAVAERTAHREQLAYVIYTSGSTGKPKGVAVTHRSLAGYTEVARAYYGVSAEDRVLQFSTFNFDGFVDQLFPPLVCGASLVVRGPELWDTREFLARLYRHGITVAACLTTAYWYQLAQDFALVPADAYAALRLVSVGGEAMPPEGLNAWRKAGLSHVRLLNIYGPTEITVVSSIQDCTLLLDDEQLPLQMPIGEPLRGRAYYLLDRDDNLAPVGVPGELCIGGSLLSRGYHDVPGLTAERFCPDPFGPPGSRLYRTGDRVRRLPNGTYEYLGRIDQQVKLRGFRIELGEIESRLQSHPEVRQAVVIVREDRPGDRRLVAYVVYQAQPLAITALREHIAKHLPDYMVPSAFVTLEQIPLTPGGKLNRAALPAPDYSLQATQVRGPQTPQEQQLLALWQDVLGVESIDLHDNFFALGGHSLLAAQLVTRIRLALNIELPLRALFEAPTIAQLASVLSKAEASNERPIEPAPVPSHGRRLLSHAQQGMWLVQAMQPESAAYHIPSAARLRGHLDIDALHQAFQGLVQRHEALRSSFHEQDAELFVQVQPQVDLPMPLHDLSTLPAEACEDAARRLLIDLAIRPIDLRQAPLLRLHLIKLRDDEHLLLLVLHHIVSDGWSMGLLVSELTHLYRAALSGENPTLAPLPIQYSDYAAWQQRYLDEPMLERQLGYWKQALGEPQPPLDLLSDRPRPAAMSGQGARWSFQIGEHTTGALKRLCLSNGATLFMGLLGALQVCLYAQSGRQHPVIGTDVANRNRAETEGLIGFFINQLALRGDLTGNPTFSQLIQRLRPQVLEAFKHQELPFNKLVEALNPPRSLAYNPLFQVKLVLQNQPASELQMPGLDVLPERIEHGQSQLDLHLTVEEDRGTLACTLKYSTDLFDATTAEAFANAFSTLLEQVATHPERLIDELAQDLKRQTHEQRMKHLNARNEQSLARLGSTRRRTRFTTDSMEG